jgi:hypothetical protein
MKKVEAFEASDGTLLRSETECQEYEISLVWRSRIDEFLCSDITPYSGSAHATMAQKIIVAWENFKLQQP